jgi:phage terminase small subunit
VKDILSERERVFVEAYMGEASGNATKAALRAGYSEKNARQQGSRLLTKANIQHAISLRAASDPAVMTREQRQQWLTATVNNPDVPWPSRVRAIELLGKTQGDFIDRVEHTGKNGGPIQTADLSGVPTDHLRQIEALLSASGTVQ